MLDGSSFITVVRNVCGILQDTYFVFVTCIRLIFIVKRRNNVSLINVFIFAIASLLKLESVYILVHSRVVIYNMTIPENVDTHPVTALVHVHFLQ